MTERFSAADRRRWEALCAIRADNQRILRLYSDYLNLRPRFLTAEEVDGLATDCGISREEAFFVFFSAVCGLDPAASQEDCRLEQLYVREGVRLLDPTPYREDLYYQTVPFSEKRIGAWTLTTRSYLPYEPFVCGHPILKEDLREIPRIGAFSEEYRFPAVLENGVEWMTVTPNEIETMREPIAEAFGRVVTFGLGLGYFAFHAAQKSTVTEVTVVERDENLIALFREALLPHFPNAQKIRIVASDAFAYAETSLAKERFDYAFTDLWHDPSDGLSLYLRMRRLEPLSPTTRFSYWIEPTLLSYLREMLFHTLEDSALASFEEARGALLDDALRALAPKLRSADS